MPEIYHCFKMVQVGCIFDITWELIPQLCGIGGECVKTIVNWVIMVLDKSFGQPGVMQWFILELKEVTHIFWGKFVYAFKYLRAELPLPWQL